MTLPLDDLGLPSDVLVWHAGLLTLFSFGVGIMGGFVGLALGTVRLPALLLLGISPPIAAGTNIAVSTASALVGAVRHYRGGRVDIRTVLVMGVPGMGGAFVGGFTSGRAPESLLILAVGILVLWQGMELVARARRHRAIRPRAEEDAAGRPAELGHLRRREIGGAGVGLAVGVVGGAVGLILGSIRLPAMIRILRLDPRAAAGTNLFIGFTMGSMGWIGHVAHGQVDYPLVALMGTTAMAGSYLGARLTGRVSIDRLVMTMGLVLLAVGVLLLWRAVAA